MGDRCKLREENGLPDELCDRQECVFWRAVDHIGEAPGEGCALEHFELLGRDGVATWLLSVKDRIEQKVLGQRAE